MTLAETDAEAIMATASVESLYPFFILITSYLIIRLKSEQKDKMQSLENHSYLQLIDIKISL
ncbi:hypothetical protein GCM10007938_29620 [Vibrio zhanjiangensis]|uniref:Uncharacterized protein n=1 Tax=Vibrio zhanjiangensis TaxID=1046128 RepID=A0ABQ6F156_9VIBR|nr:hypothetical protein GCM10007938_29620 [Vibrio zhanjiangensis]